MPQNHSNLSLIKATEIQGVGSLIFITLLLKSLYLPTLKNQKNEKKKRRL